MRLTDGVGDGRVGTADVNISREVLAKLVVALDA